MTPSDTGILRSKLKSIVDCNRLHAFYDAPRFEAAVQRATAIDFAQIAAEWRITKELAYDLAPLVLYDIVFYCDDSGSMSFEEDGSRIQDLAFILSKVSTVATRFDSDGVEVRFMNSTITGDGITGEQGTSELLSRVRFGGMTPLGTNLDRKVIQPLVLGQANSRSMQKPVLVYAITDGEPSGEHRDTLPQVICRAKESLERSAYGSGAFAIQVAQVGKDTGAHRYLAALDSHPVVGGMVDCTSYYEMEAEEFMRKGVELTPELWLLKMCVGAIDPTYNEMD
jgi:hypothetical protein